MSIQSRTITIKTKLSLVILIVMLGLLAISAFALYNERANLLKDRQTKTRHVVDTAYGVLTYQYSLQSKGLLSEEQAKIIALDAIKALRYDDKEYFWINDLTPTVLMHPIKPALDGKDVTDLKDPNGKHLFVEFANIVKKDGAGFVSYLWPKPSFDQPVEKISYVKGFAPWGWVIGSGIYLDDIDAIFWNSTKWMMGIIAALMVVIYILLQMVIRSVTNPLSDIQHAIQRIQSTKDLSQRVQLTRNDEIGHIANSFNQMVESFQQIIHQVISGAHEVQKSSEHLNEVSGRVLLSSNTQSAEATSVASVTEKMLNSIGQVSNNTRQTYSIAQESGALSIQGEQTVNDAAEEMSKIADAVNQSSGSINQLGEESKQISAIVQTIKEIADQTNLLALNAAIEAARAGEQGRGFAVVADEVRKLAERTSKATVEISSMIDRIQSETREAVDGMREGSERVSGGVEKAHQAGKSMVTIRQGAQQVLDSVNEITAALQEQSDAGGQVAQGVESIARMADENCSAVSEIAATAERLAQMANTLQESVNQFKA
ncbi:MAG: methyl-accepting chemotaxis protein [Gallionella sp.]|nr:methyl-accepting chemotaxis protein [Gallionella sp.]